MKKAAEPALDRAHLDAYTDGDKGLQREVLALFSRQVPDYLAALEEARLDDEGWRRAAHRLKGAARTVGARSLAALAAAAEAAPAAARSRHLAPLRAEWKRVAAAIEAF